MFVKFLKRDAIKCFFDDYFLSSRRPKSYVQNSSKYLIICHSHLLYNWPYKTYVISRHGINGTIVLQLKGVVFFWFFKPMEILRDLKVSHTQKSLFFLLKKIGLSRPSNILLNSTHYFIKA